METREPAFSLKYPHLAPASQQSNECSRQHKPEPASTHRRSPDPKNAPASNVTSSAETQQSTGHRAPDWRPENQKADAHLALLFSLHHLTSTNPTPQAYHLQRCRQLFTHTKQRSIRSIFNLQRWLFSIRHPKKKKRTQQILVPAKVYWNILFLVRTPYGRSPRTCAAHLHGTCYTLLTHYTATGSSSYFIPLTQ